MSVIPKKEFPCLNRVPNRVVLEIRKEMLKIMPGKKNLKQLPKSFGRNFQRNL